MTDKNVSESETGIKTEPEVEVEAKPEAELEVEAEVEAENEIDAQDAEPVMIIDADEQGAGDPVPDEVDDASKGSEVGKTDKRADESASAKKRAWSPKRIALVVVGIVLICIGAMFGLRSCDAAQTGGATFVGTRARTGA